MPEVSRFYGIIIRIFYDDHNPPHLHAEYGGHEVLLNINTLAILGGNLPARALGMVTEWERIGSAGRSTGCSPHWRDSSTRTASLLESLPGGSR
jgi:Domain of unknown function (DUF4160)